MNPPLPLVGTAAVTENMLKRRWSAVILRHLDQGMTDPDDVIRCEEGLTASIMSERLRTMLRYGLIARYPRPAPSTVVEFRLSARGKKILKILDVIDQLDQLDRQLANGSRTLEREFGLDDPPAVERPPATLLATVKPAPNGQRSRPKFLLVPKRS